MTATLPGATAFTDSALSADLVSPKDTYQYTLTVTPDNANDVLGIDFVIEVDGNNASNVSHVLLAGAAVSTVPEPGSLALMIFSCLGIFCCF